MPTPAQVRLFSERLRTTRLQSGLGQVELAARLQVSRGAVGNWEGRHPILPRPATLKKLALQLGVPMDFLLPSVDADGGESPTHSMPGKTPRQTVPPYMRANQAPLISWASAGQARAFEDQGAVDYLATDCKDPHSYALRVEGDSMEPKYQAGDFLVLTPQVEAQNGNLVVAKTVDGSVYFKLFHRAGPMAQVVRLTSYNPAYPVLEFQTADFAFIHPVHTIIRKLRHA